MRKNLVLLGMMGVGKTTLGKVFAHRYKLKFIDIDSKIEKENSMSINKIFKIKGEKFFRLKEEIIALNALDEKNSVIALGGGAFVNEKIREKVLSLAISIWLDMNISLLEVRLKKSKIRPLLKSNNIRDELEKIYENRKNFYNLANYKIDCDKLELKEILEKITKIYENK